MEVSDEHFKECLNYIAGLPEGKAVLYILMEDCHWNKTILATDKPEVTQYHAARRGVYGSLRQWIRPEYLKEIEFDYKKKIDTNPQSPKDGISSRSDRGIQKRQTGTIRNHPKT